MKSAAPKAEPKLAGKKRPAATTVASVVKEVKAPAASIQPTIASALAKTQAVEKKKVIYQTDSTRAESN
jgi:hypothetical protein